MTRSTQHDHAALDATLTRQYQVISRSQVLAHGMTTSALHQRLRAGGPWQRLLPGVFLAVTGTPTTEQRSMAALLYAGTGGMITGAAAVGLWGVQAPRGTLIDVLIPAMRQRRSTGFVRIHLTTRMPDRVFTVGPVRMVPLARAVADAARGMTSLADVRAVVAAAVQLGRVTPGLLAAELQAGPVQGSALLRTAVSDVCDGVRSSPKLTSSICSGGPRSRNPCSILGCTRTRSSSPARTRGGRKPGWLARSTPALTTCLRRTTSAPWPATRGWPRMASPCCISPRARSGPSPERSSAPSVRPWPLPVPVPGFPSAPSRPHQRRSSARGNAMKPRFQFVRTHLVFRSYAAAACQAARTAVICSGSG